MKKIIIPIMILFVLMSFPIVTGKPDFSASSSGTSITVTIDEAYYDDVDGDGYFDDVYSLVHVSYNAQPALSFDYEVELILPSGLTFTYTFVITTNYDELYLHNYFWDHAIENGIYTLNVLVVLHNGGQVFSQASLDFDPPGGSCCTDPTFELGT